MGVEADDIHAGQFETSVMMHIHPQLVDVAAISKDFEQSLENWAALADHRSCTTQTWLVSDVAVDGVVGAPHKADRALGEDWLNQLSERLAQTLDAIEKTVNS
jgi:creatinine amidohydrolase